jgi:hypothetical protein
MRILNVCLFVLVFTLNAKAQYEKGMLLKLKGKIDQYPVEMVLNVTPNLVKGSGVIADVQGIYFYERVGEPIELYGQMKTKHIIDITEFSNNSENEHSMKLVYDPIKQACSGAWIHAKTKKKLEVTLSNQPSAAAKIKYEEFRKEDCTEKNEILKRLKKEPSYADSISFSDTSCLIHELSLIRLADDETSAKPINQLLLNELTKMDTFEIANASNYRSFKEYAETIVSDGEMATIDQTESTSIYFVDEKTLILKVFASVYSGGAHPNNFESYLNIDRATGKVILLKNKLPLKQYEKVIKEKIRERLIKKAIWENTWFADDDRNSAKAVKLPFQYALLPKGILFFYNSYEAAAYVFGPIQVFIKYSDIDPALKPLEY